MNKFGLESQYASREHKKLAEAAARADAIVATCALVIILFLVVFDGKF